MALNLIFKEYYPHPLTKVWSAITNPHALSDWLMETDFEAMEGKTFAFWRKLSSEEDSRVICQLIELTPPRRMVWSWKAPGMETPSQLIFELEPEPEGGTNFTLRHMECSEGAANDLKRSGWPGNLTNLDTWLDMTS